MTTTFRIPEVPAMDEMSVAFLGQKLESAECYLEYGSGGSTLFAISKGVNIIYSVESDLKWAEDLSERVSERGFTLNQRIQIEGIDIGPTREWGMPIDESGKERYPNYPTLIWQSIERGGVLPDVILIDGRFRVACFCECVMRAKPGTVILFDDYPPRPHYNVVEALVPVEMIIGRMAVFTVPPSVDKEKARELFEKSKYLPG